jgi:hypothetical protein
MSIQGESLSNGCGSSGSCKTSSAQIICVHVVPHFGGVLMMMSPGRSSKSSHRLLSKTVPSYRRTAVILAANSTPRAAADRLSYGAASVDLEEWPGARDSFELVFANWSEVQAGSGGQVDNGSRHEDFVRSGECGDPTRDVYCDARDVGFP